MKYFKQVSKRSFAMLLVLVMSLGLLQTTAFAIDLPDTEASFTTAPDAGDLTIPTQEPSGFDTFVPPADTVSVNSVPAPGTNAFVPPADAVAVPAGVQAFLDAAAKLPDVSGITPANAADIGVQVNEVLDMYEGLIDAGLDETEGVDAALNTVYAVYEAVLAAEEIEEGGTYAYWYDGNSLAGFGAAIGYDPKDTGKFPKTDGTDISVIPWDFYNPDHAKDYYYYVDYRNNYQPRTEPAPDPVQSSYFEKTYNWTDLKYYEPWVASPSAAAGATSSFSWRQGVTNFNDAYGGLVPTIPSVYLYRLEEVEGAEYIDGGRNGITFRANDEVKLESSGGPVYQPTGPYIQCDVPVSSTAPQGTTIQVRFRLAMGYEMEWVSSEGTYNWYVQDFILNLTVGGGSSEPDEPTADVTKYHDLYIPAGEYSTVMSFSEFYYDYYSTSYCTLSNNSYVQGDTAVASITGSELVSINNTSRRKTYNDVTIKSAENADVGDTTKLYVTYTATSPYGAYDGQETCLDVITVHIIEPREVPLDVGEQKTVTTLGKSADGTLSTSGTVFTFVEGNTSIVKGQNDKSNQRMTLTGVSEGTAVIERQYHYYRNNRSTGNADYLTTYVDVVNVTVGNPQTDDPNSIDGLAIKKEVDKTSVVGGQELTYTITVTNDSSVDKTVTVTDDLPYGVTFKSANPATGVTHNNGTVTWTPTVPAKTGTTPGSAVLTIVCTVDDTARGNLNNKAVLESADGSTLESLVATTSATPKPTQRTKTVTIVKTFIGMNGNKVAADKIPDDFALDYSYEYGGETTEGSLAKSAATPGTNNLDHPTLTWTLDVPVDNDTTSTNTTPLTVTEVNYEVDGFSWTKQTELNNSDETQHTGTYQINAGTSSPANTINNYYTANTAELGVVKRVTAIDGKAVAVDTVNPVVKVGGTVTYTITVTNTGNADANNVTVTDQLPEGLTWDMQGDDATFRQGTLTWSNLTVPANGGTVTKSFTATVTKNGAISNTAAAAIPGKDPVSSDPMVITGVQMTIKTTKKHNNITVSNGAATIPYTVTVTNNGDDLFGLDIIDKLTKVEVTDKNGNPVSEEIANAVSLTYADVKVDGTSVDAAMTREDGGIVPAITRDTKYAKGQTVTLTYNILVDNNSGAEVMVTLHNTAKGGSWATDTSGVRTRSGSSGYDVTDEAGDSVSVGGNASVVIPPKQYDVTYNWSNLPDGSGQTLPGGGSYAAGDPVTVDTTFTSATEVEAGGKTYVFSGWTVTGATVENGAFIMPGHAVTITGSWAEKKYAVTYEWTAPEGVTISDVPEDGNRYAAGDPVTVDTTFTSATEVEAGGKTYVFSGWTVTGAAVENGKFPMPGHDVTITGSWTEKTYTVTYTWSGLPDGHSETLPAEPSHKAGEAVSVNTGYAKDSEAQVDGKTYVFSGWDKSDFIMPGNDVTITGFWTEKTADRLYDVTYSWTGLPEHDGDPTLPAKASYVENAKVAVDTGYAEGREARVNGKTYVFSGWDKSDFTMPAEAVTISGSWTEKTYTVTYDWTMPEGVTIPETKPEDSNSYHEGDKVTVDSSFGGTNEVTVGDKTYVFSGWTVTGTEIENGEFPMPGHDVTVSGSWTEKTYTVTYQWTVPEGVTVPAAIPEDGNAYTKGAEVTVDITFTDASQVTVDGKTYVFSGWSTTDAEMEGGKFTMPGKNVIITGEWKVPTSKYTVQWYNEKRQPIGDKSVVRYGIAGETARVTEADKVVDGYVFAAKSASNILEAEIKPDGSTVLKLYFTTESLTVKKTASKRIEKDDNGKVTACYVDYTVTLKNNLAKPQYFIQLKDVMEKGLSFVTNEDGSLANLTYTLRKTNGTTYKSADFGSWRGYQEDDANNTVAYICFQLDAKNGYFENGDALVVKYTAKADTPVTDVTQYHNHVYATTWNA